MSTYIGNDDTSDKVIHLTYNENTIPELTAGPFIDTKFHSNNPYVNVAEYAECPRTSTWATFDDYSDAILLDYTIPAAAAAAITAGNPFMAIMPYTANGISIGISEVVAGGTHYIGGMYTQPVVFSISGSTMKVLCEVPSVVSVTEAVLDEYFPATIPLLVFDGTFLDLGNTTSGELSISRDGIVVGGVNVTSKTFITIRNGLLPPLNAGIDPSFKIVQHNRTAGSTLPDTYYTMDAINTSQATNIDLNIASGDISVGGNSLVSSAHRYWQLGASKSYNNADITHADISVDPNVGNVTLHGIRIYVGDLGIVPGNLLHINFKGRCWRFSNSVPITPYYYFMFNELLPINGNTYASIGTSGGSAYTSDAMSYNVGFDGTYLNLQVFHFAKSGITEVSPLIEIDNVVSSDSYTGVIQVLKSPVGTSTTELVSGGDALIVGADVGFTSSIATIRTLLDNPSYAWTHNGATGKYQSENGLIPNSFSYMKVTAHGHVTINWEVSCEDTFDYFGIWINSINILTATDVRSGVKYAADGDLIEFVYAKDASFNEGLDKAQVQIL